MSGLNDALRLGESLCARICHDLSSPLGVLVGMLDLLQEGVADPAEVLSMASEAGLALQSRLRLLRAAWGGTPGPLSPDDARALAAGLPGAERLTLDLDGLAPGAELAPDMGRALLAVLLMAAESLPAGGRIGVTGSPRDLIIAVDGPRSGWPTDLADCLRDEQALIAALARPRGLAMPIALLMAREAGVEVSFLLTSGGPDASPPPLRLRGD